MITSTSLIRMYFISAIASALAKSIDLEKGSEPLNHAWNTNEGKK
ncbi:hypothetical protein ACPUYX_03720 [Desulfosporosinus sp. SYSU MS00001]